MTSMSNWKPPARIDDYVLHKKDYTTLRPSDLVSIESKSSILTSDQCLEQLGINKEALTPEEMYYVAFAHKKGLANHIATACTKLFSHMDTRNGGTSALEYLKAKQEGFNKITVVPGAGGGFTFNVGFTDE